MKIYREYFRELRNLQKNANPPGIAESGFLLNKSLYRIKNFNYIAYEFRYECICIQICK